VFFSCFHRDELADCHEKKLLYLLQCYFVMIAQPSKMKEILRKNGLPNEPTLANFL